MELTMKKTVDAEGLLAAIVEGIQNKKGHGVVTLDMRMLQNSVCSYYIICNADSGIQVEAIGQSIEEEVLKQCGEKALRTDGYQNAFWVVLDYFDIMVHVFRTEARDFYRLDQLWADAKTKVYKDLD